MALVAMFETYFFDNYREQISICVLELLYQLITIDFEFDIVLLTKKLSKGFSFFVRQL